MTNKLPEYEPEEHSLSDIDDEPEVPDFDVPLIDSLPAGLLKDFMSITSTSDSPDIFKYLTFYHTLSWTIGRYFQWENVKLNLMVLLCSRPHVTHRSTLLRCDEFIRHTALKRYFQVSGVIGKVAEEFWEESNIMSGTPEGIADKIRDIKMIKEKRPFLLALSDGEFGQTLMQYGFQFGILTLLTRLQGGEAYKFELASKDKVTGLKKPRVIEKGTYATLLGGMQEPDMYLNFNHINQGLLRRILITFIPSEDLSIDKYIEFTKYGRAQQEIESRLEKIGTVLGDRMYKYKTLWTRTGIPIDFSEGAEKLINKIDKQAKLEELKYHDLISSSGLDDGRHLLILSALNALSRDSIRDNKLYVVDEDVGLAWKIINELKKQRRCICWKIGCNNELVEKKFGLCCQTVLSFIRCSSPVDGVEIMKMFQLSNENVSNITNNLVTIKQINKHNNKYVYVNCGEGGKVVTPH